FGALKSTCFPSSPRSEPSSIEALGSSDRAARGLMAYEASKRTQKTRRGKVLLGVVERLKRWLQAAGWKRNLSIFHPRVLVADWKVQRPFPISAVPGRATFRSRAEFEPG